MKIFIGKISCLALMLAMPVLLQAQERPISGANCEIPQVPTVREDANTAVELMEEAQSAVVGYQELSNDFIACVERVIERRAETATDELLVAWTELINTQVDIQEQLAAAWSEQIRLYNEAR